jgi:hypothetical protein
MIHQYHAAMGRRRFHSVSAAMDLSHRMEMFRVVPGPPSGDGPFQPQGMIHDRGEGKDQGR